MSQNPPQGFKRPTQKEVAERAGVSRATVSYVLNPPTSSRVPISDETRQRVLGAVTELGYVPNANARVLKSDRTMMIGVLVPDIQNPHFQQYLVGIDREAHRHGYSLLLFHSALIQAEEDVGLRELARRRVDGVILVSYFAPHSKEATERLVESGRPVVDVSNTESRFGQVVADYSDSARNLMAHLLELGHRRIAFVYGAANETIGLDRLNPYKEALQAAGLGPHDELIARCGSSPEEGYRAAKRLLSLKPRPTAIVALNDLLAIAVLRAAADLGLRCPEDLSVTGCDDIPVAPYLMPRLTTIHRDTERAGELAVKLLMERMRNPKAPVRTEPVPSQLVVRESTGPAPRMEQG